MLSYRVNAKAGVAMGAAPYAVELFHGGLRQIRSVGEDARLEVPTVTAFHADAGV